MLTGSNTESVKRARVEGKEPASMEEGKQPTSVHDGEGNGKKGKGKGKPEMHNLVLESVQHEYDEVFSYKFSSPDAKPIMYQAGQWGHLRAPGAEMGKGNVRHMSFASRCEEGHYLFTMDLASKSPFKQLFAAAKPGDKTVVFKIKGEFVIDPTEQQDVQQLSSWEVGLALHQCAR